MTAPRGPLLLAVVFLLGLGTCAQAQQESAWVKGGRNGFPVTIPKDGVANVGKIPFRLDAP